MSTEQARFEMGADFDEVQQAYWSQRGPDEAPDFAYRTTEGKE